MSLTANTRRELLGLHRANQGGLKYLAADELSTTLLARYTRVNLLTIRMALRNRKFYKRFVRREITLQGKPSPVFRKSDLPKLRKILVSRSPHLGPHELSTGQLASRLGTVSYKINYMAKQGRLDGLIVGNFRMGRSRAHKYDDRQLDEIDDRIFVKSVDITRQYQGVPLESVELNGVETPEDICIRRDLQEKIISAGNQLVEEGRLTKRNLAILERYLAHGKRPLSMEEIGRDHCLTRAGISLIIQKALRLINLRLNGAIFS
ncbi:hypothetical protein HZC35_04630 [Candidatus Saganbacteria bacterium]|nr:hypothetical protein [Candidatus Saganbacteria bacterium]